MNHSVYSITRTGKMKFTFESNNVDGTNPVIKMVEYLPIIRMGRKYYNLEFGDYSPEKDRIDDRVVTDNGDMRRVLKTVATTLETFFEEFPDKEVHIDGSDSVRRAYYHKLIRDYFDLIPRHFKVQGHSNNSLEIFKAGSQYDFIVISKR